MRRKSIGPWLGLLVFVYWPLAASGVAPSEGVAPPPGSDVALELSERRHDEPPALLGDLVSAAVDANAPSTRAGPIYSGLNNSGLNNSGPNYAEIQYRAHRSQLESSWFEGSPDLLKRAERLERLTLEYGTDMENAARAIVVSESGEDSLALARLAVRIAPGLPMAHMALARALVEAGEYGDALPAMIRGIASIPRHLEASLWLVGSLLLMLASVLIAASLVFIAVIGFSRCRDAAHDLGDLLSRKLPGFARAAMLASLMSLPLLAGEGLLGLLLVLFAIGFAYGTRKHRTTLVVSAVMAVLGLYPVLHGAGMVLGALDADPVASASLSLIRGTETPNELALLAHHERQGDELAARVLAMRSSRMGEMLDAEARFQRLASRVPGDVAALSALGNLSFRQGRTEEAIKYYERAGAVSAPAVLLFNLSQAYAKAFRMEEMEQSLQLAQNLDADTAMTLSAFGDTELVADLPFEMERIRARMLHAANGGAFSSVALGMLAPGRAGGGWKVTATAFGLAALLAGLIAGRFRHASLCERCGRRICARCDDGMWSNVMCDSCHHLFHRPQGTDPELRMARLEALRRRGDRLDKIKTACSMIVPGASGLFAKRPGLCLAGIVFFAWAAVLFLWRNGAVPDPLAVGSAGPLAFVLAGCGAALLYAGVVASGLMIRRSL